jgi:chemosensory pili system protein ChpA (sensor histidine kinase/response regulator)
MRDIFLEEAREVIEAAVAGSSELRRQPGNLEQLTSLRRGFHTLKGSSRMVGLREFGEAAWACEQVFNAHLAEHAPATDALLDLSDWSMAYMQSWVDELSSGAGVSHEPQPVLERVEQYKRSLIADTEAGSQAPNLLSLAASPVLTPEPGPSSKEVSAPAESAAFSLDDGDGAPGVHGCLGHCRRICCRTRVAGTVRVATSGVLGGDD